MAGPMPRPVKLDAQGLPEGYNFRPEWEVTPRQVKAMLDAQDEFVLIDCRTVPESKIASIPGAELLPIQELGNHLPDLEEIKDRKIVIHCHHGGRSLQMAYMLRHQGFKDVKSMAGGIDIWAVDVDPTLARY